MCKDTKKKTKEPNKYIYYLLVYIKIICIFANIIDNKVSKTTKYERK